MQSVLPLACFPTLVPRVLVWPFWPFVSRWTEIHSTRFDIPAKLRPLLIRQLCRCRGYQWLRHQETDMERLGFASSQKSHLINSGCQVWNLDSLEGLLLKKQTRTGVLAMNQTIEQQNCFVINDNSELYTWSDILHSPGQNAHECRA